MLMLTQPIGELLKQWQEQRIITPLDRHFALELARIESISTTDDHSDNGSSALFLLVCALLSQQLSNQHSCLVIEQINLANPMTEDTHRQTQVNCQITKIGRAHV